MARIENIGKALKETKAKVETVETKVNDEVLLKADVVDGLSSTSTNKPLSANKGRLLNENKLNKSNLSESLNSTSTTKALNLKGAKILNELKLNIEQYLADLTQYYKKGEIDTKFFDNNNLLNGLISDKLDKDKIVIENGGKRMMLNNPFYQFGIKDYNSNESNFMRMQYNGVGESIFYYKDVNANSAKTIRLNDIVKRSELDLYATKDTVYTREQLDEKFNEVNQTLTNAVVGLAHTSDLETMQQIMEDLQTELNNLSSGFRLQLAQNGWLMEHISDNNIQSGIRLQNASGKKVDLKINGSGESVLFFTTGGSGETIKLKEVVTDDELSARIDEVIAMVSNTVQETEILLYDSANNIDQLSGYNFGPLAEQGSWEAIVKFDNPNTSNDYITFTIQNTGQSAYGNTGMDNDFGTTLVNPDGLGVIEMMTKRWFHWNGQTATRLEIQEWVDARDAGKLNSLAGGVFNVETSRSNAVYFKADTHDIKKFTIRRVGTNNIGG